MLKNMRVGTKLAGILVAPLLVLGILAGVGVRDRLARAEDARRAERLAEVVAQTAAASHQLQLEELRAAVVLGSGGAAGQELYLRQQAVTDAAVMALRGALVPFAAGPVAERADTLADRTANLADLRQGTTDRTLDLEQSLNGYRTVVDAATGIFEAAQDEPSLPDIAQQLVAATTLSKAKSANAEAAALVTGALAAGRATPELAASAARAAADASRRSDSFFEQASPELNARLRNVQASAEARALGVVSESILQTAVGTSPVEAVDDEAAVSFADASAQQLGKVLDVESEIAQGVFVQASSLRTDAVTTVRLYLAGVGLGLLAALIVAFFVARAITRPLRQLTVAADQLATEQLPSLVDQLRAPDEGTPVNALVGIPVGGRDEIGRLAQAFNMVQDTTTQVATEQAALLRKGVSELFLNLARRNQALLDRQIDFIDQLESNETDPDQLDNLFRLDHLATRMRRNAESLLVLAGAEGPRRRGRPVGLSDVVRVAVGEVEDFTRVNLLALDEVAVDAATAVDLSHLLAELMENATQFSPPEMRVEVVGHHTNDGNYVLSVSDQGIGMSPEHLAEANELLTHPPVMGLALSRSLGFTVVGRLARRHHLSVRLAAAPAGGITALVSIPAELVNEVNPPARTPQTGPARTPAGRPPTGRPERTPVGVGAGAGQTRPPAGPARPANGTADRAAAARAAAAAVPVARNGTVTRAAASEAAPHLRAVRGGDGPGTPADGGQSFTYSDPGDDDLQVIDTRPSTPVRALRPAVDAELPTPAPPATEPAAPELPTPEPPVIESPTIDLRSARPGSADPAPTVPRAVPQPQTRHRRPPASVPVARPDRAADPAPPTAPAPSAPVAPATPVAPIAPAARVVPAPATPVEPPVVVEPGAGPVPPASLPTSPPLPRRSPAPQPEEPPRPVRRAESATARVARRGGGSPALSGRTRPERRSLATEPPTAAAPDALIEGSGARGATSGGRGPVPPSSESPPSSVTAAGLTRRSPRQQLRALGAEQAAGSDRPATSTRSPEEVRRVLSQYRTGLQRGRTSLTPPTTNGVDRNGEVQG